jgi:hypothetical protein
MLTVAGQVIVLGESEGPEGDANTVRELPHMTVLVRGLEAERTRKSMRAFFLSFSFFFVFMLSFAYILQNVCFEFVCSLPRFSFADSFLSICKSVPPSVSDIQGNKYALVWLILSFAFLTIRFRYFLNQQSEECEKKIRLFDINFNCMNSNTVE